MHQTLNLLTLGLVLTVALTGSVPARASDYQLQQLIMLCASEPGSPRFDEAWVDWVRKNPEEDIADAVAQIIGRAQSLRSMSSGGTAPGSYRVSSAQLAEHMQLLGANIRRTNRAR